MSLLKDKIELTLEEAQFEANKKFAGLSRGYQLAIGIAILGIIPGYFLTRTLSHAIWSRKYQTYLVSAKQSFSNAQDPRLKKITLTRASDGSYSIVAVVANDNLELSLNNQNYQFTLYDQNGNLVTPDNQAPLSGKTFLLPGQELFLIVPKIITSAVVSRATLSFPGSLEWQRKLTIPKVALTATQPDVFVQSSPPALVTQGYIINNSPYIIKQVTINLVLLDNSNQILGASVRNEFTLQPREHRTYRQLWPMLSPGQNVAQVLVMPQTNPLDPANLSSPTIQ